MLQLRIHQNLLGMRREDWDLCFDETNGKFSILHTNYFNNETTSFPCSEFNHWIAAKLRSNGFKSIRTQNNNYFAAIEIATSRNAAGKGSIKHVCYDDVRGTFFVLETVTVVTDQAKFSRQENVHQTSTQAAEIAKALWSRIGFVRMTEVTT